MTRAQWLRRAAPSLRVMIRAHHPLERRLSIRVGIKGTGPDKRLVLGATECPNGHATIELSPTIRSARLALLVLLHEMVHAAVPRFMPGEHDALFRKVARKVGFVSPFRQIHAGPRLDAELRALAKRLGPYPRGH